MRVESRYRVETAVLFAAYVIAGLAARTLVDPNLLAYLTVFTGVLILLLIVCGGWPLAYPLGAPRFGFVKSAALMTVILLLGSALTFVVIATAGFDPFLFGVMLIAVTCVWGLAFEAWPLRHLNPASATALAVPAAMGWAAALSSVAASLSPTVLTIVMTLLAFVFAFSPALCFQGFPYHGLWRQPRIGLGVLLTGFLVGLALSPLIEDGFLFGVGVPVLADVLSSFLLWSVVLSWGLLYPLGLRRMQPARGVITLVLTLVAALLWTSFLRYIGVDVLPFNLLIVLPIYAVHNAIWLRYPLKKFVPPTMLAPGQDSVDKLLDWLKVAK